MGLDEQEAAFVKAFIVKDKQARYLQFLASPKRRREILDRFNHVLDFDPSFASLVPKDARTADKLTQLLRKRGASGICHVMACSMAVDGEDLPLQEAVAEVTAHDFGSVLCCLLGRLAFYKGQAIGEEWYIFERTERQAT